jgi:hypothetical protein
VGSFVVALMLLSRRQAGVWFVLYALNLAITVVFDDFFSGWRQTGQPGHRSFVFCDEHGHLLHDYLRVCNVLCAHGRF